jgi:hypothetical protein
MPGWMQFGPYGMSTSGSDMPDDKEILKHRSEILQAELDAIQMRLEDMET